MKKFFFLTLFIASIILQAFSQTTPVAPNGLSIAQSAKIPIAKGKTKFLGCAWSYGQAANFGDYWNQVTPENAGKWGSVEGTRNVMNWAILDSSFKVAKKYHIPFKEHTLLWGAQQPSWIGGLDSANQRKEIEQWYAALAARYDTIDYIDVVNEPIHNAPNGMIPWGTTTPNVNYAKALGGAGTTGWDWVINAFRLARHYFPNSKLIMNEYNVINSTSTTQQYIQIINLLKADTLIDGIGEQAHAFTTYGVSSSTLKSNLDLLAATGIPIYLTEMDIDGQTDLIQLKEYQRVFPVFWTHPGVKGITLWGFRIGLWRNTQGAFLLTKTGAERPAMKWLKAYVNDTLTLTQSIGVSAANNADSIFVGDKLQMSAWVLPANTTIPNVTWSVTPSSMANIDSVGMLTAKAAGKVSVKATAWDGSGVTGTMDITIEKAPNAINNLSFENISVYPNPVVNGNFKIQGIEKIKQIELIDLFGVKVAWFNNLNQPSINIRINVKPGVYIIKLFDGQRSAYKKITIN